MIAMSCMQIDVYVRRLMERLTEHNSLADNITDTDTGAQADSVTMSDNLKTTTEANQREQVLMVHDAVTDFARCTDDGVWNALCEWRRVWKRAWHKLLTRIRPTHG